MMFSVYYFRFTVEFPVLLAPLLVFTALSAGFDGPYVVNAAIRSLCNPSVHPRLPNNHLSHMLKSKYWWMPDMYRHLVARLHGKTRTLVVRAVGILLLVFGAVFIAVAWGFGVLLPVYSLWGDNK